MPTRTWACHAGPARDFRALVRRLALAAVLGAPAAGVPDAHAEAPYDVAWSRQVGAAGSWSTGVAVDALGNAYITGSTGGSLAGPNAGFFDAFLIKYDALGNRLWSRQFGTAGGAGYDVAVDALGNAYITGWTDGLLLVKFAAPSLPGDFNRDGAVDGADFLAWQRGLGSIYDADDLNAWRSRFAAPAAAAVPEPAALALVALALAPLLARRRRTGWLGSKRSAAPSASAGGSKTRPQPPSVPAKISAPLFAGSPSSALQSCGMASEVRRRGHVASKFRMPTRTRSCRPVP